MRRTVNSDSDVKAFAAVSSLPIQMYAANEVTLTTVGIAFNRNLHSSQRCDQWPLPFVN